MSEVNSIIWLSRASLRVMLIWDSSISSSRKATAQMALMVCLGTEAMAEI